MPPNNYPFYNDDEKYIPIMQADGGQLSGMALFLFFTRIFQNPPYLGLQYAVEIATKNQTACQLCSTKVMLSKNTSPMYMFLLEASNAHRSGKKYSEPINFIFKLFDCSADWKPLYNPSAEQAEIDRQCAYESGIPHGKPHKTYVFLDF